MDTILVKGGKGQVGKELAKFRAMQLLEKMPLGIVKRAAARHRKKMNKAKFEKQKPICERVCMDYWMKKNEGEKEEGIEQNCTDAGPANGLDKQGGWIRPKVLIAGGVILIGLATFVFALTWRVENALFGSVVKTINETNRKSKQVRVIIPPEKNRSEAIDWSKQERESGKTAQNEPAAGVSAEEAGSGLDKGKEGRPEAEAASGTARPAAKSERRILKKGDTLYYLKKHGMTVGFTFEKFNENGNLVGRRTDNGNWVEISPNDIWADVGGGALKKARAVHGADGKK